MVCGLIKYYVKRLIRITLDIFVKIIGLIYPSERNYLPPITDRLLLEPAVNLVKLIKNGQLKSEDLVKAYIDRIKLVQPQINAVVDECYAQAVLDAIEVDKRVKHEIDGNEPLNGESVHSQPLLGIPFSGKDSIAIKDMYFTSGIPARRGIKATEDAPVIQYMRKAGAIPVCMTNVPEMLLWWDTYNKLYGRSLNPYDKSVIAGGSTGGNGSLVASAGSVIGIGSDIGGSIRIPSFCCGVFGHSTTPELVPTDNHWPPYPEGRLKLLSYGPMVRYAVDIKPVLKVFVGDNVSKLKLDERVEINQLKVYYMFEIKDPIYTPVNHEIRKGMEKVVNHLQSLGATVKEVYLDKFNDSFEIWLSAMKVEGARQLAEEVTNRKGFINPSVEFFKSIYGGSEHTSAAIFGSYFEKYSPSEEHINEFKRRGNELKKELHQLLGNDGILLFPPHPETAVKHNATLFKYKNCAYTGVFNAMQVAITQVPLGLSNDGLPIGVQVIAKPFNDHLTIAVAEELEKQFGGWVPPSRIAC